MCINRYFLLIIILVCFCRCIKAPKSYSDTNQPTDSIARQIELINAKIDAISEKIGINIDSVVLKDEKHGKTSHLDSVRSKMHLAYQNAQIEISEIEPFTVKDSLSPCTPCDMNFLVYLDKKEDYSKYDIETLICLDNNDACDDSAEFVTYYNEIVFKVFRKKLQKMSPKDIKKYLEDNELNVEFLNPIADGNSIKFIDSMKARAQQRKK